MMILFYIVIFVGSCFLLARSVGSLIKLLSLLRHVLRLSEFTVAFVLMAIATSLPELLVGISAALSQASALALGSIFGTNIVNLTLIVGLVAFAARGVKADSRLIRQNLGASLIVGLIPFLMLFDGRLSRLDSGILLLIFVVYLILLFRGRRKSKERFEKIEIKRIFRTFLLFIFALIVILVSSRLIVYSAIEIAEALDFPLLVVGLVVLALGTSLPELVFGLKAALASHPDMNLGNILGSTVVNVTLVLGTVGLIHPLVLENRFSIWFTALFSFLIFALFFIFSFSRKRISRTEGTILIVLYFVFVAIQLVGFKGFL